ncbi:MAG: hypothetical protein KME22_09285 [Hassallia sp. WJT32-NPBG1]|nr:hypothetical protein [Hassallia sp. WJT32-NPBG1]
MGVIVLIIWTLSATGTLSHPELTQYLNIKVLTNIKNMATETRLSIRVTPEELDQFKAQANAAGISLTDWVRNSLLKRGTDVNNLSSEVTDLKHRLEVLEGIIKRS